MTEMIDSVDVSGCKGYKDKHCRYETSIMFTEDNLCSNFSNCHYRQLKRLEQENAKLKEENFKLGQIDIKKVTLVENRQLEEENKKLKEKLEKIRNLVSRYRSCYAEPILEIIEGAEE